MSHIKFGSWDKENTDGNPICLRTVDKQKWKIESRGIKLPGSSEDTEIYKLRFIDLDPAYPDVYAPDEDWKVTTAYLASSVFDDDADLFEVNYADNYARVSKPCAETLEYIKNS